MGGRRLVLEITERDGIGNDPASLEAMKTLADRGVPFAIDDFGDRVLLDRLPAGHAGADHQDRPVVLGEHRPRRALLRAAVLDHHDGPGARPRRRRGGHRAGQPARPPARPRARAVRAGLPHAPADAAGPAAPGARREPGPPATVWPEPAPAPAQRHARALDPARRRPFVRASWRPSTTVHGSAVPGRRRQDGAGSCRPPRATAEASPVPTATRSPAEASRPAPDRDPDRRRHRDSPQDRAESVARARLATCRAQRS